MPNFVPILRPDCEIKRISDNQFIVLVNDRKEFIDLDRATGDLIDNLIPLINGKRSVNEIAQLIIKKSKKRFSGSEVKAVIKNLFKWGLISTYGNNKDSQWKYENFSLVQTSYFATITSYPMEIQKKLRKVCVAVMGAKYISPLILRSLYSCGIKHVRLVGNPIIESEEMSFFTFPNLEKGTDWYTALSKEASFMRLNLDIVLLPDLHSSSFISELKKVDVLLIVVPSLDPELILEMNKICLNAGIKLLFGGINFSEVVLGPFVIPFESACLTCRELRYRRDYSSNDLANVTAEIKEYYSYYSKFNKTPVLLASFLSAYAHIICGYTCSHILGVSTSLINREIVIDFHNIKMMSYTILKLPRCPSCGYQTRQPEYKSFEVQ